MINYEVVGNGEKTLVFLHGWGGNKNSFDSLVSTLKYNYKIIKIDLYGFGKSPVPNYIDNIYDYAMELYLDLKTLNLGEFSIIAHSFGGRLALILGSFFELEIKNLFLIGCAGIKPRWNLKTSLKIAYYKICKKLKNIKLLKINLDKFGSDDYKNLSTEKRKLFVSVVNEDLKWLLKNINQNAIIFNGNQDSATPLYMAKILHLKIKNSQLYILKNGDHFCFNTHKYLILEQIDLLA